MSVTSLSPATPPGGTSGGTLSLPVLPTVQSPKIRGGRGSGTGGGALHASFDGAQASPSGGALLGTSVNE